jgi:preprotein translocase subunit SecG
MKKMVMLLLVGLVALILVQRQRSAKAEADLWREATTPDI